MAENDVFLRPDAGDGENGVRLRIDDATALPLAPGVGFVTIDGLVAVMGGEDLNRARVTIQGRIPTVVDLSIPGGGDATATPGVGLAIAQGLAPALGLERVLTPDAGLVTIGGLSGNVLSEGQESPTTGLLVIQGLAPTISTSGEVTATALPDVGLITIGGLVPTYGGLISRHYPSKKRRRGTYSPLPETSDQPAVSVPVTPPPSYLPGTPAPLRVGLGALAGMDLRVAVAALPDDSEAVAAAASASQARIRARRRREEQAILRILLAA